MKVAIGADHKGFPLKERIKDHLKERNIEVIDYGTDSEKSVDYPDFGLKVAHAVADDDVDFGINICWTGNGMNIAGNKVKGIRSALCLQEEMALLARQHNDANVLALASKYVPENEWLKIVDVFLNTDFDNGRHTDRLAKITAEE